MNLAQLQAIMPMAPVAWLNALISEIPNWGINVPTRQAAFVGHVSYESNQFCRLQENLSYSAGRLLQVWPSRFPTVESAIRYANNPEELANKVYANRLGNGGEDSRDGWRYRGRGPIQLTGKANYVAAGKAIGADLIGDPDLLLTPKYGVRSAGWYWQSHGLNELADEGTDGVIHQIQLSLQELDDQLLTTERINGGRTGFMGRLAAITRARTVLIRE